MAEVVALQYEDQYGDEWVDAVYSEREYDEYQIQAGSVYRRYGDERADVSLMNLTLYVDELTGVVVSDIAKYEASLK